jgi:dienelactone hydrolase
MLIALAAFALLAPDATSDLLEWMDRIAQSQLDAREKQVVAITTRNAAEARQREVREKILRTIGPLSDYDGPLNARTTGWLPGQGYRIEKVVFESLPRYFVTGNLYVPEESGKHPGILFPMGHWDEGKAAAQQMAANLARKGFVVFAYDPVGQGERLQVYDRRSGSSLAGGATDQHILLGAQSVLLGRTFAAWRIWDAKRALDYLMSRPEVETSKIGCTGCSGGGTLTTYISALDPRIKVAAPSCYMNSFRVLFRGPVGDSEQSPPGFLAAGLDQTDYVELFAPKPWLITSTEQDFFTPAGARIVYEEAKRWYGIFGAEDRIKWVVGPGGHGTPLPVREAVYDWFIRWLGEPGAKPSSSDEKLELRPNHELRVGELGQVALDFESRELTDINLEVLKPHATAIAAIKDDVRTLVAHHPPENIKRDLNGTIRFDADSGLTLTARLLGGAASGRRPAVLVVQSQGEPSERARALAESGNTVLVLVPRGLPAPGMSRPVGDWLANTRAGLIGRSLPAMRAHDILCGLDVLLRQPEVDASVPVFATAEDTAGIWLLMAAALDERIGEVQLHKTPWSIRAIVASPLARNPFDAVIRPAVALSWDLEDLVAAIRPRKVVWTDPVDWMRHVVVRDGFHYSVSTP